MNDELFEDIVKNEKWADGFTETYINKYCNFIFKNKKVVYVIFIILSTILVFFPMIIVTNVYIYTIILFLNMFVIVFSLYKILDIEFKIDYNDKIKSIKQLNLFRDFDLKLEEKDENNRRY